MAITKLTAVSSLVTIIAFLCVFAEAQNFNGPNRSRISLEGPHIRNLGYSGNIPESKIFVRKTQENQRRLTKGDSCDENEQQCAKVFHSSFHPRVSKARDDYGTLTNEPVHQGPLKLEIRNLNLKPIKNATSTDFTPRGYVHVDYGVSLVSNFLFKTIVTLVFVKSVEFVFNLVWNTAWKFAGWGVDHESTSVTLGGFGHPFAHYSTGWSDGSNSELGWGNSYGHNPYSFSYHDHSLHRPTGNIYYPGNKYYSGSHKNIKALKKAEKKYGKKKHSKKYSKYFLPAIEYFDLDERRGKFDERKGKLEDSRGKLNEGKEKLDVSKVKLEESKGKLDESKGKLDENIDKLDEVIGKLDESNGKLDEKKEKVEEKKGESS